MSENITKIVYSFLLTSSFALVNKNAFALRTKAQFLYGALHLSQVTTFRCVAPIRITIH